MECEKLFEPDPISVPGEFYRVNHECISCGVPQAAAPDLIGRADENQSQCYWKKQPETQEVMDQAFAIFRGQCVGAHRYAGHDPAIQARIGSGDCDYWDGRPRDGQVKYDGPNFWTESGIFERIWAKVTRRR